MISCIDDPQNQECHCEIRSANTGVLLQTLSAPPISVFETVRQCYGVPCLGDVDGDGYLDLALTVYSNQYFRNNDRNGRKGRTKVIVFIGTVNGFQKNNYYLWDYNDGVDEINFSSPMIAAKDIDGDGRDELFLAVFYIYLWEIEGEANPFIPVVS